MEITTIVKDQVQWNASQEHPLQTTVIREIQPELDYHFFYATNGNKHLFYLTKLGPLFVARMQFPVPNEASLREFANYCSKKRWIYYITTFAKLPFFPVADEGFTHVVDMNAPVIQKGARCNVKHAWKAGITVARVKDAAGWTDMNKIHNALLEKKDIAHNPEKREAMYKTLYSYEGVHTALYGAFKDGVMIAGTVVAFVNCMALFTKCATLPDKYADAPGPIILSTIFEQEKQCFTSFDMNIGVDGQYKTEGEIANIIKFKTQFGVRVPTYTHMPRWFYQIKRARQKLREITGL